MSDPFCKTPMAIRNGQFKDSGKTGNTGMHRSLGAGGAKHSSTQRSEDEVMTSANRSGRVTVPANGERTVITAGLSGNSHAIYRFFNSGKVGEKITVNESSGGGSPTLTKLADVEWKDSVDVPVEKKAIVVKAGGIEAEVVYDFLGLT